MHLIPKTAIDRTTAALFVLGFAVILAAMLLSGGLIFLKAGAACWLLAYFIVLIENLRSRRPIQTRGGLVRPEDGRARYFAPYVPLFIMGAIAAAVLATV